MTITLFPHRSDVAVFFSLILFWIGAIIVGFITMPAYTGKNREWYDRISTQIRGMPPRWLFPILWTILYILIVISLFIFYHDSYPTGTSQGYAIDAVTMLFAFNMLSNISWAYVFFAARRSGIALAMILFILASGIAILSIMGVNAYWPSFGCFLPYLLWCCYAVYLNAAWVHFDEADIRSYTPVLHIGRKKTINAS